MERGERKWRSDDAHNPAWRPCAPERVQQEMEQIFRSFVPGRPRVANRQDGVWRPPVEVYETEADLVVTAEIAGVVEAQLSVVVEQDLLQIRGERLDDRKGERRSYHETGIARGRFAADVYIPFPIDADRAEADYSNGLLRIRLPKAAARTIVARRADATETRG